MKRIRLFVALALLAHPLGAQLAATVPSTDPVYDQLIIAADLMAMHGVITGQRPWSRREIVRIALAIDAEILARKSGKSTRPLPKASEQRA